jgi:hypothetical protein
MRNLSFCNSQGGKMYTKIALLVHITFGQLWRSTVIVSNGSSGARGLNLIRRFAAGEALDAEEMAAMRAAMYLLVQYVNPPRDENAFRWHGPEHFMLEIWPKVKDRQEVMSGLFGDGAKAP